MRKTKGFTLAEVLITLGIIGIIAAMTVPTLLAKYQKHTYVVGLKKFYSQINQAAQIAISQEGCDDLWCALEANKEDSNDDAIYPLAPFIKRYMKVALDCTGVNTNMPECANKPFTEEEIVNADSHGYLVLADGTMLLDSWHYLWVDVNGKKGPNKVGRDQFPFEVEYESDTDKQKVIRYFSRFEPIGLAYHSYKLSYDDILELCSIHEGESKIYNPYYCTARVLLEDTMNY